MSGVISQGAQGGEAPFVKNYCSVWGGGAQPL